MERTEVWGIYEEEKELLGHLSVKRGMYTRRGSGMNGMKRVPVNCLLAFTAGMGGKHWISCGRGIHSALFGAANAFAGKRLPWQ